MVERKVEKKREITAEVENEEGEKLSQFRRDTLDATTQAHSTTYNVRGRKFKI